MTWHITKRPKYYNNHYNDDDEIATEVSDDDISTRGSDYYDKYTFSPDEFKKKATEVKI